MIEGMFHRLTRVSSKPPMVVYLAVLLVLGAWGTKNLNLIGRGLVIVGVYTLLDLAIGRWREGKWLTPSSAWVSGLILAIVLTPVAPWWVTLLAPVIASVSKHFLRFRRRHVFNPAAFALVTLALLLPQQSLVSWWGAAWGLIPLALITLSGVVTIFRVKRWKTTVAFLIVYLAAAGVFLVSRGGTLTDLQTLVFDGTLVFFATVMLIEPVTTAYQPAYLRTWFGAGVAVLTILFSLPVITIPLPDPFLVSLLLGNAGVTIASRLLRS